VIVDLDATIVEAHSEKEGASATFKRTFGFHPVLAFVDHGAEGSGEPLAALLREGRANANNAADQIALVDAALTQLPEQVRGRVLVRGDAAAGVQALLHHLAALGLQYSVGVNARQPVADAVAALPRQCWRSAIDADGPPRDGAQVAELTRHLPASHAGWPAECGSSPDGSARTLVRSCGSPITTGGGSPCSRPTPSADRSPRRAAAPAARPRRGPHPRAQRQRTAQPAAAPVREERHLARARPARRRAAHLDPNPRVHRQRRQALGTQTDPAAAATRGRPARHHRSTPLAATATRLAMGRAHHRRTRPPARPPLTPNPQPHEPTRRAGDHSAGAHPRTEPATPQRHQPDPRNQDHERSRLSDGK
jgi:hypothetical protein